MPKIHSCLVKIHNNSGMSMRFLRYWYDSGRVADGYKWPAIIADGTHEDTLNYEIDWSLVGCSGYVIYEMGGSEITIAFSNPSVGHNKLGVGTTGKNVWDEMSHHGYDNFNVLLTIASKKLLFHCNCTGSKMNICTVNIKPGQIVVSYIARYT